jgi:curved DNA-binding protein CbpA
MPPLFDPKINPYCILGVSKTASTKEVKGKFKELAKALHPDSSKGNKVSNSRDNQQSEPSTAELRSGGRRTPKAWKNERRII